jgi:uncharacterized RDD family membrane protein YckC
MASDDSNQGFRAAPPPHPFDEKWYVRTENETLGPYDGWRVKELIETGQVRRNTLIARVGASEWSSVKDIPAFDGLVTGVKTASRPQVPATQPAFAEGSIRYAGFWIRVAAYLIDYVIVNLIVIVVSGVVGLIIGLVIGGLAAQRGEQATLPTSISLIGGAVGLVIVLVYYIKFNSGRWQATPGKRLLGIHLIKPDGQPIGGWLACGRYFAYIISALPFCIGFMMAGWNEDKKALHDMICGTRVIYGKL